MKDLFKVNNIVKINWDEFAKDFIKMLTNFQDVITNYRFMYFISLCLAE